MNLLWYCLRIPLNNTGLRECQSGFVSGIKLQKRILHYLLVIIHCYTFEKHEETDYDKRGINLNMFKRIPLATVKFWSYNIKILI